MDAQAKKQERYRIDIDCLRAFAMMMVVLYHCHFSAFSGGFVGVDIFFVISGYVMFRTVSRHARFGIVETLGFYQKRLFRIYPAILLTLFLTCVVALFLMSTKDMDYFGKQMFFSGLSMSNVLFAQGRNYFSSDVPALLHTWSLAVEMQFYVLFPFFIMLLRGVSRVSENAGKVFVIAALVVSAIAAEYVSESMASFYLLQARVFEFLMGVAAAMLIIETPEVTKKRLTFLPALVAVALMSALGLSAVFFDNGAHHPGLYSLFPTLPAMALLMFFALYRFDNNLGRRVAYLGRLSYGMYLFHFPVTYFVAQLISDNPWALLAANVVLTFPLAALSYHFYETPLRRYGYKQSRFGLVLVGAIIFGALGLSGFGYITAKQGGWPQRLQYLNPYAYEVSQQHEEAGEYFTRGYNVSSGDNARILFIGDSVLQQYIDPIARALGISADQVDSVTRGGCVLLKGVDFDDIYADISCNDLREKLYKLDKTYDYVVISQIWPAYRKVILNAALTKKGDDNSYIMPFLDKTLTYWQSRAKQIVVIGTHPFVTHKRSLEISPNLSRERYAEYRDSLALRRDGRIDLNKLSLETRALEYENARVIHPVDIFCGLDFECILHDGEYSYFRDGDHLTKPGQNVAEQFFRVRSQ